jgi:AcrR family transcriptional regulator
MVSMTSTAGPSRSGPAYHHGNLPDVLRASAAELLAEKGPAGFSLREVARRAGVSHAAPTHHFGSVEGLLTEVAIEAFEELQRAFQSAAEASTDPLDRLTRQGQAYVTVAATHPGHCAIVFRRDIVDDEDPRYADAGFAAYAELVGTIEAIRDSHNPSLDVELASRLTWSAMQGLLVLYPNMVAMALDKGAPIDSMLDITTQFSGLLIHGLATPSSPA